MSSVVLIARAILAVVFVTAAVAKLTDLVGSRRTVAEFGMPDAVARIGGTALPFAELASAVALLLQPTARWAGVAAAVLLVVFLAGIVNALGHGRTPDCNCFGQVSSSRIGWPTLARNIVLLALAAFVIWKAPGSSLTAWTGNHAAANLLASLAVVACALLAILAIHYRQVITTLPGSAAASGPQDVTPLAIGELAPRFALPTLDGDSVALQALCDRGLPVVVVFASQTCGPCRELLPEIARWNAALGDRITFAVIESDIREPEPLAEEIGTAGEFLTLFEGGHEVAARYRIIATPTAVAIGADGNVARASAQGSVQIEQLVRVLLQRDDGRSPAALPVTLVGQPS